MFKKQSAGWKQGSSTCPTDQRGRLLSGETSGHLLMKIRPLWPMGVCAGLVEEAFL